MPETLSGVVLIDEALVRSSYVTPLQVFIMKTAQLVRGIDVYAHEHGLKYRKQDFVLTGGGNIAGAAYLKLQVEAHQIHVTEADTLNRRWYAVPDDLIGGWACATAPRPVSEIHQGNTDHRVPVDCWGRATAEHVASLHNAWLDHGRISPPEADALDAAFLERMRAFSTRTFGPGARTGGILDHLRKELIEVEAEPHDLDEWADLMILAIDGAWRHGGEPQEIIDHIRAKVARNEARTWPDWRGLPEDRAIEHDRSAEADD